MNHPLRRPVTVAGPWRFLTAFPILPSCFSIDKTARAPVLFICFSNIRGRFNSVKQLLQEERRIRR